MRISEIIPKWDSLLEDEELDENFNPVWVKLDQDRENVMHGRKPKKTAGDRDKEIYDQVDAEEKRALGIPVE